MVMTVAPVAGPLVGATVSRPMRRTRTSALSSVTLDALRCRDSGLRLWGWSSGHTGSGYNVQDLEF